MIMNYKYEINQNVFVLSGPKKGQNGTICYRTYIENLLFEPKYEYLYELNFDCDGDEFWKEEMLGSHASLVPNWKVLNPVKVDPDVEMIEKILAKD